MSRPRAVLIYRLGSLGDTVVALPCFHLVARAYPNCKRILLTNAPVHSKAPAAWSVLGNSGLIDGYLSYPVGTRSVLELGRLCLQIRRLGADTVIYLTPPRGDAALRRDELFFRFCGIKKVIGVPRGDLGAHAYDGASDRYEAEAARLARCIAPVGDARLHDPRSWALLLQESERARAHSVLEPLGAAPFLALGIGSKRDTTDWGIENWKALMPRLHSTFPRHALVFIGAQEDRPSVSAAAACWPGNFLDLSGELSPRESAAVIQRSDLYLGLDSGPMHLAVSVGKPCVGVFSARNLPGVWFPFGAAHEIVYHKTECFGCRLEVCHLEKKKCITSITVEEVVDAALRALGPFRNPARTLIPFPLEQHSAANSSPGRHVS